MYRQIELSYDFKALEPHIDEQTMITHYTKHHAAYTNSLNAAIDKSPALADRSIEALLAGLGAIEDEALRNTVRNNGGGFYNHNLYFGIMSPKGGGAPTGALAAQIDRDFGSLDALRERLSGLAAGRFGSGWAWLSAAKDGSLHASSSANQDNPLMDANGHIPILGIDVWEHAYYLKYRNLRADYIKAFWSVVNWDAVAKLYDAARA